MTNGLSESETVTPGQWQIGQPVAPMIIDLVAAQSEMPAIQKTGINPHFGHGYVQMHDLMAAVLPILNAHNIAVVQRPTVLDGRPALTTTLLHTSGETIETTMLLLAIKDDPQAQGSAITYARRYSLMAMLGLSADEDDDGQRASQAPRQQRAQPRQQAPSAPAARPPVCKTHGEAMRFDNKGKPPVWRCIDTACQLTIKADEWRAHLANEKKAGAPATNGTGPTITQPQSKKLHILLAKYETNDVRLALVDQKFPALKPGEDGKRHTSGLTKDEASKAIELLQRMETATEATT